MKKINYITNLDLKVSSGGWSGINKNIFNQLSKSFKVNLIGPINPPFILVEKAIAKLQRKFGFKSNFSFFSEKRLLKIKKEFANVDSNKSDAYFFFGNTPWVKIETNKPYYVYMDADFITYLKIFSDFSAFSQNSINRIVNQEKKWLENAESIFFGSNWIMNETMQNLDLTYCKKKFIVVNTGGHIPIPAKDTYEYNSEKLNLLFISLNFEKKGGQIAVNVLIELKKTFPKSTLTIIGEKPPNNILLIDGINYLGLLNKDKPEELNIMINAFKNATFLVHPTKMDTMGAIIPEANYYGIPVIASNRFGIPDLIEHNLTGVLIEESEKETDISSNIKRIFSNETNYLKMRARARLFSIENFSWDAIGNKISKAIK